MALFLLLELIDFGPFQAQEIRQWDVVVIVDQTTRLHVILQPTIVGPIVVAGFRLLLLLFLLLLLVGRFHLLLLDNHQPSVDESRSRIKGERALQLQRPLHFQRCKNQRLDRNQKYQ